MDAAAVLRPLAAATQQQNVPVIGYVNWIGPAFGEKNMRSPANGRLLASWR